MLWTNIIFELQNTNTMKFEFSNLTELLLTFNTEEKCKAHFEQQRWRGKIICPHCGTDKTPYRTTTGFKCSNNKCYKKFTITVGTVLEQTNIKLQKWFSAIYLFTSHKKGISSCQLADDIGVSQKTAWFMLHRIREIYTPKDDTKLTGIIQIDETFVGGKTKNMHKRKRDAVHAAGSSAVHMNPVFGLMNEGTVRVIPVPYTDQETLMPIIEAWVEKSSTIVTDGHGAYAPVKKDYTHQIVNHTEDEYVSNGFHTNSIESFWAHFKRTIYGTYYHVSGHHLAKYCYESTYRFNTRDIASSERFNLTLRNVSGRLTYKQLIAK